ncbi:MAG: GGDEF domain-containing protein [Spirochaetales bacterium]|nr:GGDEF domain-containing protein [Spirochaetales bacterium]
MYYSDDEWVKLISTLIVNPVLPRNFTVDPSLLKNPEFKKLYDYLMDMRSLSSALSRGDLQHFVYGKGFILSNLKALQSNLRHLTWQTKKVADGDFSQRVDFLGEFSDAFNEMTVKLHDLTMRLTQLANMDTLTKIPNRRALEAFLVDSFKNAVGNKKPFSIIIFDIDFFKSTNDTYGHDAGDAVLVQVSGRLNRQFRAHDIFSRYGGDEFMAVLPGTSLRAAEKIAERARASVEEAEIPLNANDSIKVTVSAGISERLENDIRYEDVIKKSDRALYVAKKTGRNRVCCG